MFKYTYLIREATKDTSIIVASPNVLKSMNHENRLKIFDTNKVFIAYETSDLYVPFRIKQVHARDIDRIIFSQNIHDAMFFIPISETSRGLNFIVSDDNDILTRLVSLKAFL